MDAEFEPAKITQLESLKVDIETARHKVALKELEATGEETTALKVEEEAAKRSASIGPIDAPTDRIAVIEALKLEEEAARLQASIAALRGDGLSRSRDRQAFTLEISKVMSPMLLSIVVAVTAYCGVNQHAQNMTEREFKVKQLELDRSFRSKIIKDYLDLPDNTSLQRRDMLAFIAATDEREDVRAWATATKKDLDARVEELGAKVAPYYMPGAPGQPGGMQAARCDVTIRAPGAARPHELSKTQPLTPPIDNEQQQRDCRALADAACNERGMDPKLCSEKYELIVVPSGAPRPPPGLADAPQGGSPPISDFVAPITSALATGGLLGKFCMIGREDGFISSCGYASIPDCLANRPNSLSECADKPAAAFCFGFDRGRPRVNCYTGLAGCEAERREFRPSDLKSLGAKCEEIPI